MSSGSASKANAPAYEQMSKRRNQAAPATLIAVHSVDVKLITVCSRMVSVVEPLRQRSQPNSMPMQNVCKLPNQSYCVCAAEKTSDVNSSVPGTPSGETAHPRSTKPPQRVFSPAHAATTTASQRS